MTIGSGILRFRDDKTKGRGRGAPGIELCVGPEDSAGHVPRGSGDRGAHADFHERSNLSPIASSGRATIPVFTLSLHFPTDPRFLVATVDKVYFYDLAAAKQAEVNLDWDRGLRALAGGDERRLHRTAGRWRLHEAGALHAAWRHLVAQINLQRR